MHIVVCANSTWTIWNFRRALVEALISDGHKMTVLAPVDDTGALLEEIGCRVLDLNMKAKGLNPAREFFTIKRIQNTLKEERADVALSYTIKSNIYCAIASRLEGIPSIPNVTGLGTAFISGSIIKFVAENIIKQSFKRCPFVFLQNSDDMQYFISKNMIDPARAVSVPGSGIDLEFFKPADISLCYPEENILMISRIIRQKGVVEFVEAARLVKSRRPDVRFQILGDIAAQNHSAVSRNTLREWVEDGVVEYLGTSVDVRPHIARAACVVLPSYREGAPRALLEAAAMARPIITTDVPGCRSVVEDGVSGFLCAAKSAESLADAILRFLDLSRDSRSQMGFEGRQKMEREFDQRRVIDAYRRSLAELPRKIAYVR